MSELPENHDAIVIGGSYAGLSAAMQLARARRRVLVIDAGIRRNRFAAASHGFLGRDGRSPDSIGEEARRQVLAYPDAKCRDATVVDAERTQTGFSVLDAEGRHFRARRLVLATGVVDELPEIEGLASRWGKSVFHCPYCHGYELERGKIGVLATGPMSLHQAMLLPDWGEVIFFTNDAFAPDESQRGALSARGVVIEPQRIARIVDAATIEMVDGRRFVLDGVFTASRTRVASPIAARLGCEFEEGPLGSFIRTDAFKETSVPGVFACGDAARAAGSIALAVGDGALAGAGAHQSLVFR